MGILHFAFRTPYIPIYENNVIILRILLNENDIVIIIMNGPVWLDVQEAHM